MTRTHLPDSPSAHILVWRLHLGEQTGEIGRAGWVGTRLVDARQFALHIGPLRAGNWEVLRHRLVSRLPHRSVYGECLRPSIFATIGLCACAAARRDQSTPQLPNSLTIAADRSDGKHWQGPRGAQGAPCFWFTASTGRHTEKQGRPSRMLRRTLARLSPRLEVVSMLGLAGSSVWPFCLVRLAPGILW